MATKSDVVSLFTIPELRSALAACDLSRFATRDRRSMLEILETCSARQLIDFLEDVERTRLDEIARSLHCAPERMATYDLVRRLFFVPQVNWRRIKRSRAAPPPPPPAADCVFALLTDDEIQDLAEAAAGNALDESRTQRVAMLWHLSRPDLVRVLDVLSRTRIKELLRAMARSDKGQMKASLIARLLEAEPSLRR